MKDIATEAGVSPALVIHHFGSKDGLRAACDKHVVETIRNLKREAMAHNKDGDPLQIIRQQQGGPPLQRYIARTLADGSPHVAALLDEIVEDAMAYTATGIQNGMLKPSTDLRARVVVLTIWSLGALMLHEHIERLLGVDILDNAKGWATWMVPAGEILSKGIMDEALYEKWRAAMETLTNEQQEGSH